MFNPAKNTICIWYDKDAEEAARFYVRIPLIVTGDSGGS